MKSQTILTILTAIMLGTSSLTFAQNLEENKVDEFTNITVKRTSWEMLKQYKMFGKQPKFMAYFRISRIADIDFFDFKLMFESGRVFSIDEDQEIMFKLNNGEIVKLPNIKFTISCTGCGAIGLIGSQVQGINISYPIAKEQFEKLKNDTVVKIRIYTSDGYVEEDIEDYNSRKISTALKLVE